ncbi:MAG: hypothetical protein N2049_01350 [Anaerolineales bacterium]|nr:hypothetical protein [Anaerolineales bacterium]MCX7607852.1 hypothetical protein [Anaerolineales bacterium]MDW8227862.1 hypothetical protein [Anaerolineales bacterium]
MTAKPKQETRLYEWDTMALPPLRLVLGEISAPDPQGRRPARDPETARELEQTVKKLIAHLKADEK